MSAAGPDRRAKVLWLTKGLGRGGAERLLVSAAKRLEGGRFDVQVAYVLPHKDAHVAELEAAGVATHCLGHANGRRREAAAMGSGGLGWVPRLRRLLRRERFDLIHTHSPVAAAAARLVAPRGTPLLHTEHNQWPRYRRLTRAANALTLPRNQRVLAVSDGVAASIDLVPPLRRATPPVETLIHGIAPEDVISGAEAAAAARRTLGIPADDLVVGSVGNLTPKKDQATLLEAVARLPAPLHPVWVVILGDGPERDALRQRAHELRLGARTLLPGSRDDVPALLPALDVFALPSLHEGLSIALVEALAAGVPAVASRVGGIPEVLTDEAGLLVPPRDPEALSAALATLLGDPAQRRRLGKGAAQRARDFSIDPAVERMVTVYDEVLA